MTTVVTGRLSSEEPNVSKAMAGISPSNTALVRRNNSNDQLLRPRMSNGQVENVATQQDDFAAAVRRSSMAMPAYF
jgi:hypothetical protein